MWGRAREGGNGGCRERGGKGVREGGRDEWRGGRAERVGSPVGTPCGSLQMRRGEEERGRGRSVGRVATVGRDGGREGERVGRRQRGRDVGVILCIDQSMTTALQGRMFRDGGDVRPQEDQRQSACPAFYQRLSIRSEAGHEKMMSLQSEISSFHLLSSHLPPCRQHRQVQLRDQWRPLHVPR